MSRFLKSLSAGVWSLWVVTAVGCVPDATSPVDSDGTQSVTTDTDADTDTDTDTDTSTTTTTSLEAYDCATLPATPLGFRTVPGARGYHDVGFDTEGYIFGATSSFGADLIRVDFDGNAQVWVPNVQTVEQFTWLPDGDLAVSSSSRGILRVAPNGGTSTINGNIHPYGLILGPDENLYAADQDKLWRVDPNSGEATQLLASGQLASGSPRVLNFNLDYTKLYLGTYGGSQGRIYVMDVDANLDPVSTPTVFASGVGTGAYHDTLGIDICGYLYVADYSTSAMYRISPSGEVQTLLQAQGLLASEYGHGMSWGTGEDGWLDDAIYVTQPYNGNTVMEVVIGVPSRHWDEGYAINLP
jgi:hypothetical protein